MELQRGAGSPEDAPSTSTSKHTPDVGNILGFAKMNNTSFYPARKIGVLPGGKLLRVQFFATGIVAAVTPDSWSPYSEQKKYRLANDRGANKLRFSKGLAELLAAKARIERDGEEELDFVDSLHASSITMSSKQPGAARKLAKLGNMDWEHDAELTQAAFNEYIVTEDDGRMFCWRCPDYVSLIPVEARRHARGHNAAPKKRSSKTSRPKQFLCSRPGCTAAFGLVTECDKHYKEQHRTKEGGYKCWDCSAAGKALVLKDYEQYRLHLTRTKTHNPESALLKCLYCDQYAVLPSRGADMKRHVQRHHGPEKWARALLLQLVSDGVDLVDCGEKEDGGDDEDVAMPGEDGEDAGHQDDEDMEEPETELDRQIKYLEEVGHSEYEKRKLNNLKERRLLFISLGINNDVAAQRHAEKERKLRLEMVRKAAAARKRAAVVVLEPRRSGRITQSSKRAWDEESSSDDSFDVDDPDHLPPAAKFAHLHPGGGEEQDGGGEEQARGGEDQAGGGEDQAGVREDQAGGGEDQAGGWEEQAGGREKQAGGWEDQAGGQEEQPESGEEQAGGGKDQAGGRDEQVGGGEEQVGGGEEQAGGGEGQAGGGEEQTRGGEVQAGGWVEEDVPGAAGDQSKRFACALCGYSCDRNRTLNRHMDDLHTPREDGRMVECTRCGDEFFTVFEMREHRKLCVIRCQYIDCSWTTIRPDKLAGHLKSHVTALRRLM